VSRFELVLQDLCIVVSPADESHREFVRQTIARETSLRKKGTQFVQEDAEGESSLVYRDAVNAGGSPSTAVSDTYSWMPGTELMRQDVKAA
jgi:hypothetical protein